MSSVSWGNSANDNSGHFTYFGDPIWLEDDNTFQDPDYYHISWGG